MMKLRNKYLASVPFGAETGPHSQWQKYPFSPIADLKFPIGKSWKTKVKIQYRHENLESFLL